MLHTNLRLAFGLCSTLLIAGGSVTIGAQESCDRIGIPTAAPRIASNNGIVRWQTWVQPPLSSDVERYTVTRAITNMDSTHRDAHWLVGRMLVRELSPGSIAKRCADVLGYPTTTSGSLFFGPTNEERVEAETMVGLTEPERMDFYFDGTVGFYGRSSELQLDLGETLQLTTRFTVFSADAETPIIDLVFESSYRAVSGDIFELSFVLLNNASPVQIQAPWLPPPVQAQLTTSAQSSDAERTPAQLSTATPPILSLQTIDVAYDNPENNSVVRMQFDVNAFLP